MFKRINFRYCVPLLLFSVFAVALSLVHSQNVSRQTRVRVVDYSEEQLANLMANFEVQETIQMLPTAQRVLLLSTETLDESFRKLATYDDGQYFEPGYTTNVWGEIPTIHELLSNRRVIKVLQEFEKLPSDQAKIKAEEFHRIAMKAISDALDKASFGVLSYENEDHYGILRQDELFMALTSLLLSASLGDIPFVMERIEDWEHTIANKFQSDEKRYNPKLMKAILDSGYHSPDPVSLVSIMVFALERKGNVPEIVNKKITETDCKTTSIPLVKWNADRTYYDVLKHQGNLPMSWEDTLMFFRVFSLQRGDEERDRTNQDIIHFLKETMASMK